MEFLITLESQIPTKRFFHTLLHDHLVILYSKKSHLAISGTNSLKKHKKHKINDISITSASGILFVQLLEILQIYAYFDVDEISTIALSKTEKSQIHYDTFKRLQKFCFANLKEETLEFSLSNVANVDTAESLKLTFSKLKTDSLITICNEMGVRTHSFDGNVMDNEFLIDALVYLLERKPDRMTDILKHSPYITENILFDESRVPSGPIYEHNYSLAIPKLNLQYLTLKDYLYRNYILFRTESAFSVREDVIDAAMRLAPKENRESFTKTDHTVFVGWSRMALPMDKLEIVKVGDSVLGEKKPSFVHANLHFSMGNSNETICQEWDDLRKNDVIFLLSFKATDLPLDDSQNTIDKVQRQFGLTHVRGCKVSHWIDSAGKQVPEGIFKEMSEADRSTGVLRTQRTLAVELDSLQYYYDAGNIKRKEMENIYETFNVILRRNPADNNFSTVLETIRDLIKRNLVIPEWFQDVFLGFGDCKSAFYKNIEDPITEIDFRDTFLDLDHLKESFSEHTIDTGKSKDLAPPFSITLPETFFDDREEKESSKVSNSKKRKSKANDNSIKVNSYPLVRMGPYPENVRRQNQVRFSPQQVQAILSGCSKGLTLLVSPPGSGNFDVVAQIISNIYHNYPKQHTLLITKSKLAMDSLINKISNLDINPGHILYLGHGMGDLEMDGEMGKAGRVNYFLEKRISYLEKVTKLAKSLEIFGDHGSTCETSDYFFTDRIEPTWNAYVAQCNTIENVKTLFPFEKFFMDAPQPLFNETCTLSEALEISHGCFDYIKNIFVELRRMRAFEILRTGVDRANYILTNEARIVAIPSEYAALKREELIQLGFNYDNIIIEESGQILEIESFIPLILQITNEESAESRLKRIVLVGDHHQLPPVVKNSALLKYSNMNQSMFSRLIKLGVPFIQLDKQGIYRNTLADLFRWNYSDLSDFENVSSGDYILSNPGFAFEYQFLDVGDFLGHGEIEPRPQFIQNLGEAEYAVAIYQYMRLIGYPAENITILASYNGQKELINDVIEKRCSWHPFFKTPGAISTIDKYQGQNNSYVILSLAKTKDIGHLSDIRRMIVALSSARLGLYILGRKSVFENVLELDPIFKLLFERPTNNLWLRTDELYEKCERNVQHTGLTLDKKKGWKVASGLEEHVKNGLKPIENVEQLGLLVQQMTKAKVDALKKHQS